MRGLGNQKPEEREKRVDFGDAVISNCKYDCKKCLLKAEGCVFKVNSIRCEVAHQRLKKILDDEQTGVKDKDDDDEDSSLVDEEKNSMADYLKNLPTETEDVDSE